MHTKLPFSGEVSAGRRAGEVVRRPSSHRLKVGCCSLPTRLRPGCRASAGPPRFRTPSTPSTPNPQPTSYATPRLASHPVICATSVFPQTNFTRWVRSTFAVQASPRGCVELWCAAYHHDTKYVCLE